MYQECTDHLIWTNYDLDLEDWRESLEELYPHYSEDELYEKMYDSNAANLDDERCNLNIENKTHLTERAEKMLEALSGDIAKPFEPTYDELNPPPEPPKEYRFSLGDSVYIGTKEYTILSLDGDTVTINDHEFPLLYEEMNRKEFDRKVSENPMNDKYLHVVESVIAESEETPDNTKVRISLNSGDDLVHWIYFNPDADAGGQYVSGDLSFSVFEELIEQYDIANQPENTEKFVSDLEEMSDQFLADINTPFFMEAENDYEMDCDYTQFTPENILGIVWYNYNIKSLILRGTKL